jgi:hypothetical protein
MDWKQVQRQICEARAFTPVDQGARVLSDAIMPSGGSVYIQFQSRGDSLAAHDGGAAFDELARHAAEVRGLSGVRRMFTDTPFRLADDGLIWLDRVEIKDAAVAIAFLSDASVRAANYMLARSITAGREKLDRRVQNKLRELYPLGKPNFTLQGLHRQHTFDFGVSIDDKTFVVEAVTPDQTSISTAVLKGLDAGKTEDHHRKIVPLFVIDEDDDWQSGNLNLLSLGGRHMSFDRLLRQGQPLQLAA